MLKNFTSVKILLIFRTQESEKKNSLTDVLKKLINKKRKKRAVIVSLYLLNLQFAKLKKKQFFLQTVIQSSLQI